MVDFQVGNTLDQPWRRRKLHSSYINDVYFVVSHLLDSRAVPLFHFSLNQPFITEINYHIKNNTCSVELSGSINKLPLITGLL